MGGFMVGMSPLCQAVVVAWYGGYSMLRPGFEAISILFQAHMYDVSRETGGVGLLYLGP